jgi:UDP-N-acetylglucosamine 1-carboxyvinyltransferase
MSYFKIEGGLKLSGTITPQGAKNEALPILNAVLMTDQPVRIHNIPDIVDVNQLISLLKGLGVKVTPIEKGSYIFQAETINEAFLESERYQDCAGTLRGSVMLLGSLLSRLSYSRLPSPGGDKIGRRHLDTHLTGFEKLGATVSFDPKRGRFDVLGKRLKGCYMLLDEASVTGTANILMAAVKAKGTTTIFNAACEPYVQQLCRMLVEMGADIKGIGSNLLEITGVDYLGGCTHTLLPDMIEVGSLIGLAGMTGSDITIKDCRIDMLGMIPRTFEKLGITLEMSGDSIRVIGQDHYKIDTLINGSLLTIADAPWPGLTPDLLSILLVVATQAEGSVLIHQKMFESRLFFVDKLIDMGARIILCDPHRATVIGLKKKTPLTGIRMVSPDIRAGVSLLIAALAANGTSLIENINQIDRGYENIDGRLNALGARIERVDS